MRSSSTEIWLAATTPNPIIKKARTTTDLLKRCVKPPSITIKRENASRLLDVNFCASAGFTSVLSKLITAGKNNNEYKQAANTPMAVNRPKYLKGGIYAAKYSPKNPAAVVSDVNVMGRHMACMATIMDSLMVSLG